MGLASAFSDAWGPWQDELWGSLGRLRGSEGLNEPAWVTELGGPPDCRRMQAVPLLLGFPVPLQYTAVPLPPYSINNTTKTPQGEHFRNWESVERKIFLAKG